jgi:hypothetical protein
MVAVAVKLPETPVMATVACPAVAVLVAVKVSALVDAVGLAPNDAVRPLGRPETESVTLPVNPFRSVIATVVLTVAP